jgi:hypothetical protein
MIHSSFRAIRAVVAVLSLTLAGCRKDRASASDNQDGSLLFDATSPAAREALATQVNFRLTDANFAQWEQAQHFLDALPTSALASAPGGSGNVIDRSVATLEASPRARTSIERTGLSVRDFVLATIALAQATEAASGRAPSGVTIPPENVQFVQRYQSRVLQARAEARAARARANTYSEADTIGVGVESSATTPEAQQGADVRTTDSATVRQRDSVTPQGQPSERPKPPADTARDTIPIPPAVRDQ